jgi:hypothetical protein
MRWINWLMIPPNNLKELFLKLIYFILFGTILVWIAGMLILEKPKSFVVKAIVWLVVSLIMNLIGALVLGFIAWYSLIKK